MQSVHLVSLLYQWVKKGDGHLLVFPLPHGLLTTDYYTSLVAVIIVLQ